MLLLESLGWIIATTLLFVAATLAFREPAAADQHRHRPRADRPRLLGVQLRPRPDPARRHGVRAAAARRRRRPNRRPRRMETLAALGHGFAVALTPVNLLWSRARRDPRHRHRRAARHRPGADRRAAAAGHLQPRADRRPSSCSPASTTAPCTAARPPRSCSTRRANRARSSPPSTATRWPAQGRGAPALATAAIGSFVAGTHRAPSALTFVAPLMVKLALLFGPAEYFALMVLAFTTVTAVLGDSPARGLASLFFGLALGPDRHRPADRPGALHARHPGAARRHRHGRRRGRPVRGRRDALRRLALPVRDRGDLCRSRARCG